MLSKDENELLSRTGPGSPMGEVLRRYWIPVALSQELPEPDCPPVPVTVLGEQLVAFRDTDGRVGLLDRFCAHRGTSLCLGRNEEAGLRCTFHGWKYDVEGRCVDTPTEPPESDLKHKVRLRAYPTLELAHVIWAYLGPADKRPEPPDLEWTQLPLDHSYVSKVWQECNWLQAAEGGIDSIHTPLLHRLLRPDSKKAGVRFQPLKWPGQKHDVLPTDYGLCYYAVTEREGDRSPVRVYHYVMPFHTYFAYETSSEPSSQSHGTAIIGGHMFVPTDDYNCMVYNLIFRCGGEITPQEIEQTEWERGRSHGELTHDFRKMRNSSNNYMIDWHVMKTETYSGIEGINTQDHAVQESMGPIVDRSREHLGFCDAQIIALRRILLDAVRRVQNGDDPPGVHPSNTWPRAIMRVLPKSVRPAVAMRAEVFAAKAPV